MAMSNIAVGSYGQTLEATIKEDSTAEDVSGFTTDKDIILKAPDGKVITLTATFKTDGTDGVIQATVTSGTFDQSGTWQIQGHVQSGSQDIYSKPEEFTVYEKLA